VTRRAPEPGAEGESWRPAPALSTSTTAGLPVIRDGAWPADPALGREPERSVPARRRRGGLHRRRFRLSGMRTRLFIGFAAVALITAAIITGSSYFLLRDSLLNRVASGAATELTDAVQLAGQQLSQDTSGTQDAAIASQLAKRGGYFVLVTPRGAAQSNSDIGVQEIPPALMDAAKTQLVQQRVIVRGVPYELTGTTVSGGPQMFLFTPLDNEQNILTELITIGSVSGGLALVGAAGVAFLATRNVLVPIRRLGHAARMLGQGDLDVRLEVKGTDEIADVSRTFNETAAALARSMDELRAMDAASRRFVADVSHELRTPLTAMTAVTEVLEDVESADPTTMSAAHLIANETKRLARLVEDLMEISRFDAGTAAMRVEDVNLAELIEATLATRGWTSKVMVTAPPLVPARVDARRIDVVVANLVGNALKHGGEPVALQLYDQGEYVVVQVADSGPGIPAEALPHIFDRFYKADRARGRSEGSGLGLSIAFENARMHGGELSAGNRPEGGAVFTLRFPNGSGGAAEDDFDGPAWGASSDGSSPSGQVPSGGRRSRGESTSGGSARDRQGART
jgi:two-component system, OmpR family, sensor histidine kinase MtrB